MQTVRELSPQVVCERLLELDSNLLYSSYLDSEGRRVGEATKDVIKMYKVLTVLLLPLRHELGSLVLATPVGSDLTEIVTKAKKIFDSES
jgi:hypothetical protein